MPVGLVLTGAVHEVVNCLAVVLLLGLLKLDYMARLLSAL